MSGATQVMTASLTRRLLDLVVLVRLPSCVAGAVGVYVGAHLATGTIAGAAERSLRASLAIGLAVAFANVVNDIVDVRVDAITKPGRPLPSGRLSARTAQILAAGLAVGSIALATTLGPLFGLWMVALIAAATGYSLWFKNTVLFGNTVVAACASAPIAFGAATAGSIPPAVWLASAMAFLFMLSYETLKTLVDRAGDEAGGVRTFATRMGPRASRRLFRGLIGALTIVAVAAVPVSTTPVAYAVAVTITFVLPSGSTMLLLGPDRDLSVPVFLMRFAWFLGIVALWLLH